MCAKTCMLLHCHQGDLRQHLRNAPAPDLQATQALVERLFPNQGIQQIHAAQGTARLHAMHSVVDWFAFGVGQDGQLQRSLSLLPDNGILENFGPKLPFEEPYWNGQHPAVAPGEDPGDCPMPFHPPRPR